MTPLRRGRHREHHRQGRTGWLRAAVLGSNDAIVSTSALMIGVASADAGPQTILLAGVAGLVGGAMSMAVGEYVSVSSQADTEDADIALEKQELVAIYVKRGLSRELALQVAKALTEKDALGAHLKDELGIEPHSRARPLQAAAASALSFAAFALVPLGAGLLAPPTVRSQGIAGVSLVALAGLGVLGARLGGAPVLRATLRVTFGGALAMGLTAAIGRFFGVSV